MAALQTYNIESSHSAIALDRMIADLRASTNYNRLARQFWAPMANMLIGPSDIACRSNLCASWARRSIYCHGSACCLPCYPSLQAQMQMGSLLLQYYVDQMHATRGHSDHSPSRNACCAGLRACCGVSVLEEHYSVLRIDFAGCEVALDASVNGDGIG